ncbi:MAG: hypothetical protein AAF561_04170 [Planctomycetota bacterium]
MSKRVAAIGSSEVLDVARLDQIAVPNPRFNYSVDARNDEPIRTVSSTKQNLTAVIKR